METHYNTWIERSTGRRLVYEYKRSWGDVYYSFDGGNSQNMNGSYGTWHRTRREAYLAALASGNLQEADKPGKL